MDAPQAPEIEIKSVALPVVVWRRITAYQHKRMLSTQRAALRELVIDRLDMVEAGDAR